MKQQLIFTGEYWFDLITSKNTKMKAIYLIRTMNLTGAKFNLYSTVHINDNDIIHKGSNGVILSAGGYQRCSYYEISEKPIGYNADEVSTLQYFAKVTEDLPGSCKKLEPAVYEKCQLTTDFPNGYLVFKDCKTGKKLKIAMNSHTYEPLNSQQ